MRVYKVLFLNNDEEGGKELEVFLLGVSIYDVVKKLEQRTEYHKYDLKGIAEACELS